MASRICSRESCSAEAGFLFWMEGRAGTLAVAFVRGAFGVGMVALAGVESISNSSSTWDRERKPITSSLCALWLLRDGMSPSEDLSPFWRRYAHHEARPLDLGRMEKASRFFLGEHDWTAFSSAHADGENKVRDVTDLTIETVWDARAQAAIIEFRISAKGFLRYMVRSIVGTLLEVGRGEKSSDTIQTAIVTGDRNLAGKTASAHGLTLLKVDYD